MLTRSANSGHWSSPVRSSVSHKKSGEVKDVDPVAELAELYEWPQGIEARHRARSGDDGEDQHTRQHCVELERSLPSEVIGQRQLDPHPRENDEGERPCDRELASTSHHCLVADGVEDHREEGADQHLGEASVGAVVDPVEIGAGLEQVQHPKRRHQGDEPDHDADRAGPGTRAKEEEHRDRDDQVELLLHCQ